MLAKEIIELHLQENDSQLLEFKASEYLNQKIQEDHIDDFLQVTLILSNILSNQKRIQECIDVLKKSLPYLNSSTSEVITSRIFRGLGTSLSELNEYAEAELYLTKSVEVLEKTDHELLKGESLTNLGVHFNNRNNSRKAIEVYTRALYIFKKYEDYFGIAATLCNLGIVYMSISDFEKAINHYRQALDNLKKNQKQDSKQLEAVLRGNIGIIYLELGNNENALEHFKMSVSLYLEIPNGELRLANTYSNIANAYHNMGNTAKAKDYNEKSLLICKKINNVSQLARVTGNLGNIYLSNREYELAMNYYQEAISLYESVDVTSGIAHVWNSIGKLYLEENYKQYDIQLGLKYIKDSLKYFTDNKLSKERLNVLKILVQYYLKVEDYKAAYPMMLEIQNLEKQIVNDKTKKSILQLELQRKLTEIEIEETSQNIIMEATRSLLVKTLPVSIVDRLLSGETGLVDKYKKVSVMIADIVDFTPMTSSMEPEDIVHLLNTLFSHFDELAKHYGIVRIKTIGDAYLALSGFPDQDVNHGFQMIEFASCILKDMNGIRQTLGIDLHLRIGIHSGEVIGALIGDAKYNYDVLGETIEITTKLESKAQPDQILVSPQFIKELPDSTNYSIISSGTIHFNEKQLLTFAIQKK